MTSNKRKPTWEQQVLDAMREFASDYSVVYSKKEREISAYFEIGCLLSLIEFYESCGFEGTVCNPAEDRSYRYLTTPNGNPANFSYMLMVKAEEKIEIRQQVRISSYVGDNISFTPDIVVIPQSTNIRELKDSDYASGKRKFFFVDSKNVIAAHECKSRPLFPELLVSFIGMLIVGHEWFRRLDFGELVADDGDHLAPCLFVGGSARSIHLKMVKGLKSAYPMNVVAGMHSGTWNLLGDNADIRRIRNPLTVGQGGRDPPTAKTIPDPPRRAISLDF